jgi:hypothetical protein
MTRLSVFLLPMLLVTTSAGSLKAQEPTDKPKREGQLSEEDLGKVLRAMSLEPTKTEKRYDFAFKNSIRGEEWKFTMSAVLSRDEESLWVMAWLDQVPRKSADVPRESLLRLLAANDRLGNGKFFAFIPSNKRFVLQRVVPNEHMNTRQLYNVLKDLSLSVADEYPVWATANWNPKTKTQVADDSSSGRAVPTNPANPNRSNRIRASESASKFTDRTVN